MRRTAIATALLLATLTACGSSSDTATKPEPSPSASSGAPSARSFDVHDCKALLERSYEANELRDASGDPECTHLSWDEYVEVVGDVIAGRKDEILTDASNQVAWDEAWDATGTDQQQVVCGRLATDGAVAVGQEMMEAAQAPSGTEVEMAQYFLEEKC
ncbi:hypothetical protein [Streptomyces sp. NPDC058603]|uniref:hypothetical protein n=1 Tax=Streptomyces sp. NPDC058603 TaxID=3346551 RepID=UPI0036604408